MASKIALGNPSDPLDAVTKKIAVVQTKRRLLEDLFRTLLHQLMTAQIRVHDLDLSELPEGV